MAIISTEGFQKAFVNMQTESQKHPFYLLGKQLFAIGVVGLLSVIPLARVSPEAATVVAAASALSLVAAGACTVANLFHTIANYG